MQEFIGEPMDDSQLTKFLQGAGDKPYRDLVAYHIKQQSVEKLQKAVIGESSLLPHNLQPLIESYIDAVNLKFGDDKGFWESATCQQAFEEIIDIAAQVFPLDGKISSVTDALKPENCELSFQLFQIPTMSFAYSASTQRKQRKFMGIRKGFFG